MIDYTELVKALRVRSRNLCPGDICDICEEIHFLCSDKVMHDAAAAIEELQAEIRESMQKCAECGDELAQQLPKRGKWIDDEFGAKCSCCGKYAYWSKYEIPWKSPYCPLCGAKMEVQDG